MRNSTRIRVVDLVSELDELRNACTEHVLHIAARYLRFVLCGSWFDVYMSYMYTAHSTAVFHHLLTDL